MSHKQNIYSAPGTPLLERTVGELVAERPGRSRVFQSFAIEEDLHRHIHLENSVLFPRAQALARAA